MFGLNERLREVVHSIKGVPTVSNIGVRVSKSTKETDNPFCQKHSEQIFILRTRCVPADFQSPDTVVRQHADETQSNTLF